MSNGPLFGQRVNSSYMSPSAMRQAAYAQQIIGNAGETSPTDMWGGISRIGQGLIGGYLGNKASEKEKAYQQALAQALGSQDPIQALNDAAQENPDLAPAATQFTMQTFAQQQALKNALQLEEAKRSGKPPETRTIERDGVKVTQQWDPTTRTFTDIAESRPEWQNPDYRNWEIERRKAGATNVAVDASTKGDQELAKLDAKTLNDLGEGVRKYREIMPDVDRVEKALTIASTGPTANVRKTLGALANEFGVKVGPETSELEIISSIQSRLAPAMRAVGSGASSDRDVSMFLDSLPNLLRTPDGNRMVIQQLRKIGERKQQEEQFMRSYYRQNGSSLDGVYDAMDKRFGPLFTAQERESMGAASQAPQQGVPAPQDIEAEMRRRGILK